MSLDRHIALAERHPHDFTIQYPPRREYFMDHFRADPGEKSLFAASKAMRRFLLYVHVPFCEAKCFYCNFAVDTRTGRDRTAAYVAALRRELSALAQRVDENVHIPGIDIGGGTPTLLDMDLLASLLDELQPFVARSNADFPLSIESTPAIAAGQPEKLACMVEHGVRRISVGIQSTNDETLASVNRDAQKSLSDRALANLTHAGFMRVNADLIFGLPAQSVDDFRDDLKRLIDAGVDSITTYDCLYRGKGRALTKRTPQLPTPQEYARLYDVGFQTLTASGFLAPYGSLNFCRHEGESGTSPYFEERLLGGLPYIGVGNYASSMTGENWSFAPYKTGDWIARIEAGESLPESDVYTLPRSELIAKHVLLSLSFGQLDATRFRAAHGVSLLQACGDAIARAIDEGWLVPHGAGDFRIAAGAFEALPRLRALFYTPRAIDWLEQKKRH